MPGPGDALLASAAGFGVVGIVLLALVLRRPGSPRARALEEHARRAIFAHWAFLALALGLLLFHFLAGDLRYEYVWEHTSRAYPWYYKLAGLWAGQEGTILLWTTLLATWVAVEARRYRSASPKPSAERDLRRHVMLLGLVATLAFTGLTLVHSPFEPTEPQLLRFSGTADGRGLQEVLVTPLMIIHPPLQFVAYALTAMPALFALASFLAPGAQWAAPALGWARPAWAVATLGLGLGGIWAYYVLSFGGYWAWDPVETANLLPWLALTAFLHAGKYRDRFGDFPLAAPFFAFAALWLTVFATFATRSGLWVSVHAFTDPTNKFDPDAAARLLAILDVHLPSRFFVGFLLAALLGAAALAARASAHRLSGWAARALQIHAALAALLAGASVVAPRAVLSGLFEIAAWLPLGSGAGLGIGALALALVGFPFLVSYLESADAPRGVVRSWLSARRLMAAAVALFAIALFVTLLLDFQVVNGMDRALFDARAPLVVLPMMAVLTLTLAQGPLGRRNALLLAGGAAALAIALGLVFREDWVIAAGVPILAGAFTAALAKMLHVNRGGSSPALRLAGTLLLVGGVLGMVMWANPPSHARLGPLTFHTEFAHGAILLPLAFLGVPAAVSCLRGGSSRLAIAGALGVTCAAGYLAGALLGAVALAIAVARRREFRGPGLGALRGDVLRFRETGIYLIHLAVVIGLLGYAASTYAATRAEVLELDLGETREVGERLELTLEPARGVFEPGALWYSRVVAPLAIVEDGRPGGKASVEFYWKGPPINHYDPALDIQRGFWRDLYVSPSAIHTPEDGWIRAHGDATRFTSANVDRVSFEIIVMPLLTFVWAGLWMMVGGMALVITATAIAARTGAAASEAKPRAAEAGARTETSG